MKFGLLISRLQYLFHVAQRLQARTLEFADPAFANLMDRHGIEVVKLLAAAFDRRDQIRLLENGQVLAHCLPRHGKALAQLTKRLSIVGAQAIQQLPSARIGQRSEYSIHGDNMQPFGCISSLVAQFPFRNPGRQGDVDPTHERPSFCCLP